MFAAAAQPDIVRASQKDQQYLSTLSEELASAVGATVGQVQRLQWERETQLAARVLFYALTTGAGSQTLGEEYCDLLQVTDGMPVEPQLARRALLIALQSLVPYCAARWAPVPQELDAEDDTMHDESPTTSLAVDELDTSRLQPLPHQRLWQQLKTYSRTAWSCLGRYSGEAARLHLALFYIFGLYYEWPKRIAGIRYAFIGKTVEQRASYRVLGTLLFAQLAITAGMGAIDALSKSLSPQFQQRVGAKAKESGCATVLRANEEVQQTSYPAASPLVDEKHQSGDDIASSRRCPLCLSVRQHPTSTPCGHLFCWNCIAQWCNKKPECPLCRSEVTTSDLVVAHAADL